MMAKSINLVDLTFFSLETVLIQRAIFGRHENISSGSRQNYIREFLMPESRIERSALGAMFLCSINY